MVGEVILHLLFFLNKLYSYPTLVGLIISDFSISGCQFFGLSLLTLFAVYIWAEGARYEGEYKEDKKNGRGVQTWPSGAR